MRVSTISVEDMHCASCAGRIRRALEPLAGIRSLHVNPVRRQVLVEHGSGVDPMEVLSRIEAAGFTPALTGLDDHDSSQKLLLKRLGVAGLAAMQVMMVSIALHAGAFSGMDLAFERLLQYTALLFSIPVVCYSAVPFLASAVHSIRAHGPLSMDVPIALAICLAFGVSLNNTLTGHGPVYYDSVVMFTFLLLCARYLDRRLRRRLDLSGQLLAALPETAQVERHGQERTVPVAELDAGDLVWVPEGAQVPVDGELLSAHAVLDEALLTGESDWPQKHRGETLFAGTLNCGPGLRLRASGPVDRSRIATISRLADQAGLRDARVVALTDRVAAIFVPAVLLLAGCTYGLWLLYDPSRALPAALTVLVVSCPCALALATPAALGAAMTRLRQLGAVLTSSPALERAADVDRLLMDKTGTLTAGSASIAAVESLDPAFDDARVLAVAAALERHSSHPYARAFAHVEPAPGLAGVTTVPGRGVQGVLDEDPVSIGSAEFVGAAGTDDRAVYLRIGQRLAARFRLGDALRPDARQAIHALRVLGIEPLMLSGDSHAHCADVAASLGIRYLARQTPEAKLAHIRREQQAGHRVLMLGDGINDIPVLARADVSAAVLEASDLVKSKADVLLLGRRLTPLVELLHMARRTRRVIRQNLGWAAAYNGAAIPLAALGLVPPWLAAVGMAASSILVLLNASRLLGAGGAAASGRPGADAVDTGPGLHRGLRIGLEV